MKAILKNLLFSLVVVTVFFGGMELTQRVRWTIKHNDESYLFYGASNIELSIARLIDRVRGEKDKSVDPDIVAVGGSTVFCTGLPRNLAWPEQLEKMLASKGHKRPLVCNLGEGGSDSRKDADRLRSYLKLHSPSMVMLFNGINDSASMMVAKNGDVYVPMDMINANFVTRLNAYLLKHSLFYTTLREKIASKSGHGIDKIYAANVLNEKDKERVVTIDGLGAIRFRKNVLEVITLAKSLGIAVFLGTPPIAGSDEGGCAKNYRISYDRIRSEVRAISKENNVPYLDLGEKFDSMEDRASLFLPDMVHVNKKGAEVETKMIYDFMVENGLV